MFSYRFVAWYQNTDNKSKQDRWDFSDFPLKKIMNSKRENKTTGKEINMG